MGVPWQPVVQPRLRVHCRQGRLGRRGVGRPHQEVQHLRHELAERHRAVWISLVILRICVYYHHLKLRLNQRLNWPKMIIKGAENAYFPPADPEGPKDRDLDPGPKID